MLLRGLFMGWILAILIIGGGIGFFIGDAVNYPYLYGWIVTSMFVVPLAFVSFIWDMIFGRRG